MASSGVVTSSYPLDIHTRRTRSWPNATSHRYLDNQRDVVLLRQLQQLPDGAVLACRGRDYCSASGDEECFPIQGVDFVHLVHLALSSFPAATIKEEQAPAMTQQPVVVLAHGWSPEVGPHYPVIQRMAAHAQRKGWKVIVPDFRPTYAYGNQRARSERVKMLYEVLIVHAAATGDSSAPPPPLALVGHSQGGAAVALSCTEKVCHALDIRGVLMAGTEDPTFHDRMDWKPPVRHVEIVHAVNDDTISLQHIRRLAKQWQCPMVELSSLSTPKGAVTTCGDDINHDFLSNDLMKGVLQAFDQFLDKCAQE